MIGNFIIMTCGFGGELDRASGGRGIMGVGGQTNWMFIATLLLKPLVL